jgi:hypothetical protein
MNNNNNNNNTRIALSVENLIKSIMDKLTLDIEYSNYIEETNNDEQNSLLTSLFNTAQSYIEYCNNYVLLLNTLNSITESSDISDISIIEDNYIELLRLISLFTHISPINNPENNDEYLDHSHISYDTITQFVTIKRYNAELNANANAYYCPISLDEIKQNDEIAEINYCKHIFKKNVFLIWAFKHNSCPVCRGQIYD